MKVYITFVFLFLSLCGLSQTINYHGYIQGEQSNSEYTVTITSLKTLPKVYSINSIKQNFQFNNIDTGLYIRCVLSGYYNSCDTIKLDSDFKNDTIRLRRKTLQEVTVKSEKPLLAIKDGVLVVNVEKSALAISGNLLEMLGKLPGVTYNVASNSLQLKGKEGIQIQIDGNMTYLNGNQLIDYLKSIAASDVSKVQIDANPSAKYDATGTAGIINIITKKVVKKGYYVGLSLSATQGRYYKQNAGLKLQYNNVKSRFMLYYLNSLNSNFEQADTKRIYTDNYSLQNSYAKILGNNNTISTQFENKFKNSNLLLTAAITLYNENIHQNSAINFMGGSKELFTVHSNHNSKNKLTNANVGIEYKWDFKLAHLTFKSNYIRYHIVNNSILSTDSDNQLNDLINISPKYVSLSISQVDFERRINNIIKIESGIKGVFQILNNKNQFYDSIYNENRFDIEKSNDFRYREFIFGGYLQGLISLKKTNLSFGSRFEHNPSRGFSQKNEFVLNRTLNNFFPFLNLSYNYSASHVFNLSYSRRINRPTFNNLLPFIYYVDPYTTIEGTPSLSPSFTNQIQLQYVYKKRFMFSFNYSHIQNQIFQVPIQNNVALTTVLRPYNIRQGALFSMDVNIPIQFTKWWNLQLNSILYFNKVNSNVALRTINSKIFSAQILASSLMNIYRGYKFECNVNYVSPFIQGPYRRDNIIVVNTGITKGLMSGKLDVSLVGNDIFKSYKIKNQSIIANQYANITQHFDTHWIRLSVVYKLSKGIKKESRSATDETISEIKNRTR